MAQQLPTNARAVVKLERGTDPKAVAALADAELTAYHAVRKAAGMLFPGTHAVVIGAGGLGHIGIQTLRALTATEITVIDLNEEALDIAKKIGAHHTVQARQTSDHSDVTKQILEIT